MSLVVERQTPNLGSQRADSSVTGTPIPDDSRGSRRRHLLPEILGFVTNDHFLAAVRGRFCLTGTDLHQHPDFSPEGIGFVPFECLLR